MASKAPLDTHLSQDVVGEMDRVLGRARVVEVLAVTPARLAALLAGRGRLAAEQLLRIAAFTRRTWPLWALDAVERNVRSEHDRTVASANGVMRSHYERFAPAEVAKAEVALGLIASPKRLGRTHLAAQGRGMSRRSRIGV